jgi:hypothetical protein
LNKQAQKTNETNKSENKLKTNIWWKQTKNKRKEKNKPNQSKANGAPEVFCQMAAQFSWPL